MNQELNNPVILQFNFKAVKPLFDIDPFFVCGQVESTEHAHHLDKTRTVHLWARDSIGNIAMEASAIIKE